MLLPPEVSKYASFSLPQLGHEMVNRRLRVVHVGPGPGELPLKHALFTPSRFSHSHPLPVHRRACSLSVHVGRPDSETWPVAETAMPVPALTGSSQFQLEPL